MEGRLETGVFPPDGGGTRTHGIVLGGEFLRDGAAARPSQRVRSAAICGCRDLFCSGLDCPPSGPERGEVGPEVVVGLYVKGGGTGA